MKNNTTEDFGILILSYDKLSDIWPITIKFFFKNIVTDGFQYPIYFGSNEVMADDPRVIPILSGKDVDWSSSYLCILKEIKCRKLFVILEDLIVSTSVNAIEFNRFVEFGLSINAMHIKYWPTPKPYLPMPDDFFGEIPKGAPYRSTVCGFWDREYLMNLLIPGESPWKFEIMGSYRTSYRDGFYTTTKPLFNFVNLIEKGSWQYDALDWAINNNVELDITSRPTLSGKNRFVSTMQKKYFRCLLKVSWKYRVKLMNILRKAFISY